MFNKICPGCSAKAEPDGFELVDGLYYECGTCIERDGSIIMSENCLLRQCEYHTTHIIRIIALLKELKSK